MMTHFMPSTSGRTLGSYQWVMEKLGRLMRILLWPRWTWKIRTQAPLLLSVPEKLLSWTLPPPHSQVPLLELNDAASLLKHGFKRDWHLKVKQSKQCRNSLSHCPAVEGGSGHWTQAKGCKALVPLKTSLTENRVKIKCQCDSRNRDYLLHKFLRATALHRLWATVDHKSHTHILGRHFVEWWKQNWKHFWNDL